MARTEVTGAQIKDRSVSLTDDVVGILPVANGGTGSDSLTLNAVLIGNGTGALQAVSPGASGNILTSNGTSWVSAPPSASQVTIDGTQTLTNKTLTSPVITGTPVTTFADTLGGSTVGRKFLQDIPIVPDMTSAGVSGGATIVGTHNNLMWLTERGGTVTVTKNDVDVTEAVGAANWFRPGGYTNLSVDATTDVYVITIAVAGMASIWGSGYWGWGQLGLNFRSGFHSKDVKLEVDSGGVWTTLLDVTNDSATAKFARFQTLNPPYAQQFRITLTNHQYVAATGLRIQNVWATLLSGNPPLTGNEIHLPRSGGAIIGTSSSPPTFTATGSDSNISINLVPKGTGTVRANNVDLVTTSGVQTLTNKTINSATINSPTLVTPTFSGAVASSITIGNSSTTRHVYVGGGTGSIVGFSPTGGNYSALATVGAHVFTGLIGDVVLSSRAAGKSIVFGTTTSGNTDVERMRISSDGTVTIGGATAVTTSASQTLTNKTLTNPTIDYPRVHTVNDQSGNPALYIGSTANAVNYLWAANAQAGATPMWRAVGSDTNISMGFRTKGSGSYIFQSASGINALEVVPIDSAVNYLRIDNSTTGNPLAIRSIGSDSTVGINFVPKGGGNVTVNGVPIVTTTGTQSLTNKTLSLPALTNPRVSGGLYDALGAPALAVTATGGTNYLAITNSTGNPGLTVASSNTDQSLFVSPKGAGTFRIYVGSGQTPTVTGSGVDANHNLNLQSQGTGVVQANGVPVVTTTGSQTLTNKTIDGASNTVTNLPASATPDAARLACRTAVGSNTTENGANTWAKIATLTNPGNYFDTNILLACVTSGYLSSTSETAILSACLNTGPGRYPSVTVMSKSGPNRFIGPDSFKIVSDTDTGAGVAELWVKKLNQYGRLDFYELGRNMYNVSSTVTYHDNAPWQSTEPTGTAFNVVSIGTAPPITVAASLRANTNIVGGGIMSVASGGEVKWSGRFMVISNGNGPSFSTAGFFQIDMPPVDTVIPGLGGASNKTVTADGIPMSGYEALYYILPIGSAQTSLPENFRVVSYTGALEIPHNWLRICIRVVDSGNVYNFANGINLLPGQSLPAYQHAASNVANSIVRRDSGGSFTATNITADGWITSGGATVVTTTGSQTLTNKTLTSPTINTPTITNATIDSLTGVATTDASQADKVYMTDQTWGRIPAFSPAPKYLWHDVLRLCRWWGTPTYETYDGATWSSQTLNKQVFAGHGYTAVRVADGTTTTGARWTWNSGNITAGYVRWWAIHLGYVGSAPTNNFLVEGSTDGVNWTTYHTSQATGQNHVAFLQSSVGLASSSWARFTITTANGQPIDINSIKALSNRVGAQGGGDEYEYPYNWDKDKNITALAGLYVTSPDNSSTSVVSVAGSQTLTNKTLNSPIIDAVKDTGGAYSFATYPIANAVNYWQFQGGATGTGASLVAIGSDTNVKATIWSKGSGSVSFRSNTNGVSLICEHPATPGVNYMKIGGAATGSAPYMKAEGTDTNVSLNLISKGSGTVQANGVEVVTTTGTQSLTNKTLTSPTITNARVDQIRDLEGRTVLGIDNVYQRLYLQPDGLPGMQIFASAGATTYAQIATYASTWVEISATGPETNVYLGLNSKGSGTVNANGVPVVTTSGSQTLTNKTISGASNTFSDIPLGSVVTLTTAAQTKNNMVSNPGFESTRFYLGQATYSTEQPRSGTYSAKITGTGSGQWIYLLSTDASAVYSSAAPGDTVYIECWVYGHASNTLTSGGFYLYSQGYTGANANVENLYSGHAYASPALNGVWTKFSGYRTLTHADIRKVMIGIYCTPPAGEVYYFDDPVVRFVTESEKINQALYGASVPASTVLQSALPSTSVSTTGVQTLTNKTLTGATLTGATLTNPTLSGNFQGNLSFTGTNSGMLINGKGWLAGVDQAGNYSPLSTINSVVLRSEAGDLFLSARGSGDIKFITQDSSVERMKIANDGKVTIVGATTHSTLTTFNTADQTTNYEKVAHYWSGDKYYIASSYGGTGTRRGIQISSAGLLDIAGTANTTGTISASVNTGSPSGVQFGVLGNLTASSGIQYGAAISPTFNQSSTAGYTALLINPTETATGSGTKNLIEAKVDATTKFTVDSTGLVNAVGGLRSNGVDAVTVSGSQTLTNKTISGASNTITNVPQSAITGLTTDLGTAQTTAETAQKFIDLKASGLPNLASDPSCSTPELWNPNGFGSNWTGEISTDQAASGTTSLKMTIIGSSYPSLTFLRTSTGNYVPDADSLKVRPGDKFYMEAYIRAHPDNVVTDKGLYIQAWSIDSTGVYSYAFINSVNTIPTSTEWTKITHTYTVPAGRDRLNVRVAGNLNHGIGDVYYIDKLLWLNVTDTQDIIDNVYQGINGGASTWNSLASMKSSLGTVVTLAGSQTLTNKTITQPTLNNPLIVSSLKDANGATLLGTTATASAVNYLDIKNAATGGHPAFTASGSDANINIDLLPKGSGHVKVGTTPQNPTSSPATINMGGTYGNYTPGNYGNLKLRLYDNGTGSNHFGLGISDSKLEYQVSNGSGHHFYVGGVEKLSITGTTLRWTGVDIPTINSSSTLTNKTISGSSNTITNLSIFSAISNAPSLFNNMGDAHTTRTSFDAQGAASTVNFGWRFVQGNTNGPGTNSALQYYSQLIGLGEGYAYNNYAMQVAYPRNVTNPYISIRYQEGGSFGAWQKISAGYADSAGNADTLDGQHASAFATLSGAETLTNKTITSPTLTTPVINGLPTGTGVASAATVSTLMSRDANGDANVRYLYSEWLSNSHAAVTRNSDTAFYSTNDNWIRKNTATGFKTSLALNNVDNTSDATKNAAVATLTNKTLLAPTITNYTESVVAIGTVTSSHTFSLTNGTVQTATLTASTACTFTMPTAAAGKSFTVFLKQAATTGNGTATFTGVKWNSAGAPTITATAGAMDILFFTADGTNWYGSYTQGYVL